MASISTLGVGSGLDLSSILDSLEAAEKSTLTPISKQQSSYTAKLSAYDAEKRTRELPDSQHSTEQSRFIYRHLNYQQFIGFQRHHHGQRDCREIHH